MRQLSNILLVAALMISIGAPWAVLQSLAWVGMTVAYSVREGSVVEGVSQTFDGRHRCVLCQTVADGTRSEAGRDDATLIPAAEKLILTTFVVEALLTPPSALRHHFPLPPEGRVPEGGAKPAVPPPRVHV